MNCMLIAVSVCLAAQAPGQLEDYEPVRVPAQQAAPPAELGDAPDWDEPAWDATEETGIPDAADSAGSVWNEPPAAETRPREPDRYAAPREEPASHMERVDNRRRQRLRPPELIAEALENPKQAALVGTPMTLTQALARAADRQSQLQITRAYWLLAAAQADYHWALRQRDVLRDHTQPYTSQSGTLSARAAARADVRAAQLAVEKAQAELANLLGQGAGRNPPLASDRPHVGEYRTHFDSLFAERAPPPRMRLIDRTLPVRRQAIDAHADAIVAGLDAVEAAGEQFRTSGQGLATLLDAIELLKHERRAFISEVRDYNLDIAEYALAVAPAGAQGDVLVSMLIRTSPPANQPAVGQPPARTRGAESNRSPRRTFRPDPNDASGATREDNAADPDDWTVNYPGELQGASVDDPALYQGLLSVANQPLRVQKLGNLLHWDHSLPREIGRPMTLADCLGDAPAHNRLAVIEAYWRTREQAARWQAQSQRLEQLNALQAIAIPLRDQPGMAEAGVRLQAARRAARAAVVDARLALVAAQFELTRAAGRPLDRSWLLPSTPPQSGRYIVSMRARRGFSSGSQWAERLALQYDKLQHRADAVIQSDAHRADLVSQARSEASSSAAEDHLTMLDRVVWSVGRQNQQTLAFLRDLTDYNMAIANYALVTLPEGLSGAELAGKLAIARSTIRDS